METNGSESTSHGLPGVPDGRKRRVSHWPLLAGAIALFLPQGAQALPSYARQTGMSCIACHTEFPILTDFGRTFKLNGYTLSNGQTQYPPFAVMLQPSFTQTNGNQVGGAAPHFAKNSNFAISQASLFYGGRLFGPYAETLFGPTAAAFLNKIGVFSQMTYDGVARRLTWDNTEIRFADSLTTSLMPITYGFYANNNPGLQDPWNSTPAWDFPFSSSHLAPTPAAGTLIEGGLAQEVVGLGAYALFSDCVYIDVAGYHTLGVGFQKGVGIDPDGETQVPGIAPYWRLAYTKSFGNQSFEAGLFGLSAATYPARVNSEGKDYLTDLGFDAEDQISFGKNDLTATFRAIHEWDDFGASQRLGNTSNKSDELWSTKITLDYLYDKTYGGAISYFFIDGTHDALLNTGSANGSPLSDGIVLQSITCHSTKTAGRPSGQRATSSFPFNTLSITNSTARTAAQATTTPCISRPGSFFRRPGDRSARSRANEVRSKRDGLLPGSGRGGGSQRRGPARKERACGGKGSHAALASRSLRRRARMRRLLYRDV